ncbi:glutathione transferase [Caenorhabditis elegans]|uniref:glutathione transferase n=1 Tax=Caenorhabditis elegans TaxID=6239 RepID=Q93699_CAEEL|nr:GST C-terminal domain-containing protein [Caenorhabditis elegans]CAB02292.2 GST C-terminal domain-containing protein [Caenorhabditis elegans]|eukprot:NP_001309453.1 Glutathione S-Transferase [Caenorhabditis elegans]
MGQKEENDPNAHYSDPNAHYSDPNEFEIPQSGAINSYLARKFGFAGKTAKDQAWVDATTDLYKDFFEVFRKMIRARRNKLPADELAKLTSEILIPARHPYFEILNGILERNKSGYLVGDDITLADLAISENVDSLKNYGLFKAEEQPKLAALREKVYSHSALKNYIANRPFTEH